MTAPAVVVLDGSANAMVADQLYQPWRIELVTIDAPISPAVEIYQISTTVSTRKLVQDDRVLDRTIRYVANVCDELEILLDGGVSYLKATDQLHEQLGGTWLHYGGQRGSNTLATAHNIAIIASPTTPPDAILRKAMALWSNAAPIGNQNMAKWYRGSAVAEYKAHDPRLEAMNQLHGPEELRQAAHRCRPILADVPTKLLIFSPWNLSKLELEPTAIVPQLAYSNSNRNHTAYESYRWNLDQSLTRCNKLADSNKLYIYSKNTPLIGNGENIANVSEYPPRPALSSDSASGEEFSLKEEQILAETGWGWPYIERVGQTFERHISECEAAEAKPESIAANTEASHKRAVRICRETSIAAGGLSEKRREYAYAT